MSRNEHTPGPWYLDGDDIYASGAGGEVTAPRFVIGSVRGPMSQPERRANARALAAAPEVIAALKAVRLLLLEIAESAGDDALWNEGGRGRAVANQVRSALERAGQK